MRHNEMRVGDITYAETEEWVCDFSVMQKSMAGGLFLTNPFPLCLPTASKSRGCKEK